MIKIIIIIFFLFVIVFMAKSIKKRKKHFHSKEKKKRYFSGEISQFWYSMLSSRDQEIYDFLVEEISKMSFEIDMRDMGFMISNPEELQKAILYDHPEFFWIENFSFAYTDELKEMSKVVVHSLYSQYEIESRKLQIENAANRILNQLTLKMDDYEKALIIHDIIINETSYSSLGKNDQYIDSVLIDHLSVCAGYSKTFHYLLNLAGIEATTVSGIGRKDRHAWNLVCLDGNYSYIDVTWDDPTSSYSRCEEILSHDYFGITTDELLRTHSFVLDNSVYPVCTSIADNYFVRENRYYQTADHFLSDMWLSLNSGENHFEGKLKNPKDINRVLKRLVSGLTNARGITYSTNKEMGIIEVRR